MENVRKGVEYSFAAPVSCCPLSVLMATELIVYKLIERYTEVILLFVMGVFQLKHICLRAPMNVDVMLIH